MVQVNEYGMTPISYISDTFIYILILGIRGGLLSSEAMHGEYPCRANRCTCGFLLVTGTGLSVLLLMARLADEVGSGHLHRSLLLMLNR